MALNDFDTKITQVRTSVDNVQTELANKADKATAVNSMDVEAIVERSLDTGGLHSCLAA